MSAKEELFVMSFRDKKGQPKSEEFKATNLHSAALHAVEHAQRKGWVLVNVRRAAKEEKK